jgi:hypothetical protein
MSQGPVYEPSVASYQAREPEFYLLLFVFRFFGVVVFNAFSIAALYMGISTIATRYTLLEQAEQDERRMTAGQRMLLEAREGEVGGTEGLKGDETRLGAFMASKAKDVEPRDNAASEGWCAGSGCASVLAVLGSCASWCRRACGNPRGDAVFDEGQQVFKSVTNSGRRAHSQALLKLQLYASRPENQFRTFLSHSEIRSVTRLTSAQVDDLFQLVGAINVYSSEVHRKFESRQLRALARGETPSSYSAKQVLLAENRASSVLQKQQEGKGQRKANTIKDVAERMDAVEDITGFGIKVLTQDLDRVVGQQKAQVEQLRSAARRIHEFKQSVLRATIEAEERQRRDHDLDL